MAPAPRASPVSPSSCNNFAPKQHGPVVATLLAPTEAEVAEEEEVQIEEEEESEAP